MEIVQLFSKKHTAGGMIWRKYVSCVSKKIREERKKKQQVDPKQVQILN